MRGDDIDTLHTLSLADMQAMMLFDDAIQCSAVETPTNALPFLEMLTDAYCMIRWFHMFSWLSRRHAWETMTTHRAVRGFAG